MNKLIAYKTISLAISVIGNGTMQDSARLCLDDASKLFDAEQYELSIKRALRSIEYSVGRFHQTYIEATEL